MNIMCVYSDSKVRKDITLHNEKEIAVLSPFTSVWRSTNLRMEIKYFPAAFSGHVKLFYVPANHGYLMKI